MCKLKSPTFISILAISSVILSACSSPSKNQVLDLDKCLSIKLSIANISDEIKDMKTAELYDDSAVRATMRAGQMTFGAVAQSNLITLGNLGGCDMTDISLPLSITGLDEGSNDGSL